MSKQLPKPAVALPKPVLLSINADAKTSKGFKVGTVTAILYLAPGTEADDQNLERTKKRDLCAWASPACRKMCLYFSGRAEFMPSIPKARIRKTNLYFENKELFMLQLRADLAMLAAWQQTTGVEVAVRLDGTSDIHLAKRFARLFPNLVFYDYTKSIHHLFTNKLANLHLTFSRSETNAEECRQALAAGYSVAVVWRKKSVIPATWEGFDVYDGDADDRRFADREVYNIPKDQGFVVSLTAKGRKAKADTSGFVLD